MNAVFAYRGEAPPVDAVELGRVRDNMAPRGPDGAGTWISPDGRVGLGHRRLAIIDPSPSGAQPMRLAAPEGELVLVFNGEIYNYRELRADLEAGGAAFHSRSDTEVLLHLYRREGLGLIRRLRGMYAFALWDGGRRTLLAARDPFGIKPLYVADDGRTLRLASQVKALLAGGRVDASPSAAGHCGFFLWGHLPEPFTLYRGIRALEPGRALVVAEGAAPVERQLIDIVAELGAAEAGSRSARSVAAQVAAALTDSIRMHLVADVPVGAFLSAGRDASTLAAIAHRLGQPLRTLTLGFAEYRGTAADEVPLAEETAQRVSAAHVTRLMRRDDFLAERARILDAMDQPTIDGINTYFVAKAAHEAGLKVALSGVGADELFHGYRYATLVPRMIAWTRWARRLPGLAARLRQAGTPLARLLGRPKLAGVLELGPNWETAYFLCRGLRMPWELPELLAPEMVQEGLGELALHERIAAVAGRVANPRAKMVALEACFYMRNQLLRDTDWASMRHSLEVRTPFIDLDLWRALAPLLAAPQPPGKETMAAIGADLLPRAVLAKRKTGFQIPVATWEVVRDARSWASVLYAHFRGGVPGPLGTPLGA